MKRSKKKYRFGSVYKKADRGTYSIVWPEDGSRKYEHGFETETLAAKRLAIIQGDRAAGKQRVVRGGRTLNDHSVGWLEARALTHRSVYSDVNRWQNHFDKTLGRMGPNDVTTTVLKGFIASKRKVMAPSSVGGLLHLLSSLYSDLIEDGHAAVNPCRSLSIKTRKLLKSKHDPKLTPFVREMSDVVRIYRGLGDKAPALGIAYAIGVNAGLRTSEIRALDWSHIDLERGIILVQLQAEERKGRHPSTFSEVGTQRPKDEDSRAVPIQPALAPILASWRAQGAGLGLVCPPLPHSNPGSRFIHGDTMNAYLQEVLIDLHLEMRCSCCGIRAAWYEYTRHTMASHYVIAGGSLETLKAMLGHSSVVVTERYAHLRPGVFSISDRNRLTTDFGPETVKSATGTATGAVPAASFGRLKIAK